jgi:Na+-driven multidrug efflux pump
MLLFLILNIIAQFYFLGVILVFLTVGLNMIFIPIYGILGSAFATLLSITLYSLAKLMFVVKGSTYFLLLNKRYILWV